MKIAEIPILPLGRPGRTVLVYHGLGADKEVQRKELESLAQAGFFAVGVDAVGHGERAWPDREARMAHQPQQTLLRMVHETVREIPSLIHELRSRYGAGPFGVAGISMGGFATFAAPLVEPGLIQAAVAILGCPDWEAFWSGPHELLAHSPHRFPQRFAPVALLALNAGRDENVPPGPARDFMQRLRPYYQACPERLEYREYPDSGHFMPEEEWNDLWRRTLDWFERWL